MPLKKGLKSLKKLAEIVDTSAKDASRARKVSRSPRMQQEIATDRRTGLSKNFGTVRQAIADRDRIAKQKARKPKPR
jgi:hypothetical protein